MNYMWTNTETSTVLVQELQRNGDHSKDCDRLKNGDHQIIVTIRRFLIVGHCLDYDCPKDGDHSRYWELPGIVVVLGIVTVLW